MIRLWIICFKTSWIANVWIFPCYEALWILHGWIFPFFFMNYGLRMDVLKNGSFQLSLLKAMLDVQWMELGIAHGWWQQLHDKFVGQLSENGPHPIFNGSVTSTDICIIYLQIMAGIWYLERKCILKHSIFDI